MKCVICGSKRTKHVKEIIVKGQVTYSCDACKVIFISLETKKKKVSIK